jgi:hypothetical protein
MSVLCRIYDIGEGMSERDGKLLSHSPRATPSLREGRKDSEEGREGLGWREGGREGGRERGR